MVFVYTKTLLAGAMKPLNMLSKFENHFAIKTIHFQVSLDAGGYFSAREVFAFATAANLLKCVKRKNQKIQTKIIVAGCS